MTQKVMLVLLVLYKKKIMSYKVKIWNFMDLMKMYFDKKLNLNPPYQRNSIWSLQAQKLLIDTVKRDLPIPAFFIQEKENDSFEMVDGQQRTRALLGYIIENGFTDKDSKKHVEGEFDNYEIAVNILSKDLPVEEVREFYVRVNKTGAKLERPELNKAEFFDTNFLKLVTELADLEQFKKLNLFSLSVKKRMFDRDFVEELVALYLFGNVDKKKAVDKLFNEDIDNVKYNGIKKGFEEIINIIYNLNEFIDLSKTRYNQKNDFYTLFGLIIKIKNISFPDLKLLFKNLVSISEGVSPSNENCEPLQEYAFNCITQSNSKKARMKRLEITEKILLNTNDKPNKVQKEIIKYFKLDSALKSVNKFHIVNI